MNASKYQKKIIPLLKKHFKVVENEWAIYRDATDQFGRYEGVYFPRIDVAVGPFNNKREGWESARENILVHKEHPLVAQLIESIDTNDLNKNPRCLLAIEVSFSGSSKHILGDIANASIMGLVGIIIANSKTYEQVSRISKYLTIVSGLEKTPLNLFRNVKIFSKEEFIEFVRVSNIKSQKFYSSKRFADMI